MGQGESRSIPIGGRKIVRQKQLAEGAYGFVDLAIDKRTKEPFALKRVLAQDAETTRIAQLEIDVMTRLHPHPHIVFLHGSASRALDADAPTHAQALRREYFILMEYCNRGTLAQAITARQAAQRPYAEKEALNILLAVCSAIEHMHCQQPPIVHRDLKPENVLISADGDLKLCDFGSCTTEAKVFASPAEIGALEEQVQKYSTATYRAPEQVDVYARKFVGPPVDVWALGCILFVLLYFELAFPTGSAAQISSAAHTRPAPADRRRYSPRLHALMARLFEIDPLRRPTVTAVIEEVNALLQAPTYVPSPDDDRQCDAAAASSHASPVAHAPAKPKKEKASGGKFASGHSSAVLASTTAPAHSVAASITDSWDAFGDEATGDAGDTVATTAAVVTGDASATQASADEFDSFQSAAPVDA